MSDDQRRFAASAGNNLPHILKVLARHVPATGDALEIASGTGQHIAAFAAAHPGIHWQASERDPANFASIRAWAAQRPTPNLRAPVELDAAQRGWSAAHSHQALIIMANILHLVTTSAAEIILSETAKALAAGGVLLVYGPFLREGQTTSAGDAQFDASLRAQDPAIGYKDLDWVYAQLALAQLTVQTEAMPANNLMLIARKAVAPPDPSYR
ncbi:MAG: hypothetical protein ACJASV_000576 [Pseudorhodobacter sp.]|jgi:hypothetical protein